MLEMVGNLEFYQANETDLDCIFKIVDSVGWGETYEDIQRVIKNPDNKYLTVFDRKTAEIIGITLAVVNDDVGYIGHVIVKPEYRKMGIGEELMNEAINYLKFKGCKTIKLDAVTEAVTLYERTGFKFEFNSLRYLKTITSTEEIEKLLEKCSTVEQKNVVNNCKEDDLREIFEADHESLIIVRKMISEKFLKLIMNSLVEIEITSYWVCLRIIRNFVSLLEILMNS